MTYQTQSKIVNTPVSNSFLSESENFPDYTISDLTNKHFRNLHKIIKQNPIDEETDVFQLVKQINNYINKNSDINTIDSKELNAEISIKGYCFSKNHGQLKLIKKYYTPLCRSSKPIQLK